jgi:hypothetical protein
MIDEMNRRLSDGDAQRTALLKTMLPVEAISAITPNRARSRALRIADW